MYNKDMYELGSKRSVIRELFEFGKKRIAEIGQKNVYDFSLGNPNVPAPKKVNETIKKLVDNLDSTILHGYTSAQGDVTVREAIANNIKRRFNIDMDKNLIYMTCGAAASLCISLGALSEGNDEFIIFAPFFPEYRVFIKASNGKPVIVPFIEDNFQIDIEKFKASITENTKAVIINSPNNPCGVIYSEETIIALTTILKEASKKYNHPIFIIADEPYRELVYDDIKVPYLMNYYDNTIICYSYSKSLSLPGERIGYIAINPKAEDAQGLYAAVCGCGRSLGYVCAPNLFQQIAKECVDELPDINAYKANRDLLYNSLSEMGYSCVHPDGAFYLFVKALEEDANKFADKAKEFNLLLVPGDDFAAPGYVRIAYCVSNDMIKRSMPAFKKLIDSYKG